MKGKLAGYIALGCVVIHICLSFMNTAPKQYRISFLDTISQSYVFPFMPQNWELFAPEVPQDNYDIVVNFPDEEEFHLMDSVLNRSTLGALSLDHSVAVGLYNYCYFLDAELTHNQDSYYRKGLDSVVYRAVYYVKDVSYYGSWGYYVVKNDNIIYFKRIESTIE